MFEVEWIGKVGYCVMSIGGGLDARVIILLDNLVTGHNILIVYISER